MGLSEEHRDNKQINAQGHVGVMHFMQPGNQMARWVLSWNIGAGLFGDVAFGG